MSEQDQPTNLATRYLTSLNRHLRKHGLGDTVVSIDMPRYGRPGEAFACRYDTADLHMLADWLRTLRDSTVTVHAFSEKLERTVHLRAVGVLDDGTVTSVKVIVDGDEFDLLATNTPLVKDAAIPVVLLLSLVSAEAAESRVEPVLAGAS